MLWLAIMFLWLNIGRIIDEPNLDKKKQNKTSPSSLYMRSIIMHKRPVYSNTPLKYPVASPPNTSLARLHLLFGRYATS